MRVPDDIGSSICFLQSATSLDIIFVIRTRSSYRQNIISCGATGWIFDETGTIIVPSGAPGLLDWGA